MFGRILGEKLPTRRGVKNLTLFGGYPAGQHGPKRALTRTNLLKTLKNAGFLSVLCGQQRAKCGNLLRYQASLLPSQTRFLARFSLKTRKNTVFYAVLL